MNERVKELHLRAGLWASDQLPFTNPEWVELRDKKFAELIVRECVNLCYDRAYRGTFGSVTDGAMLCANDIKEQFGVKNDYRKRSP